VEKDVAAVDAAHGQVVRAVVMKVVSAQSSHRSKVVDARASRIGAIRHVTSRHVPGTVPTKCSTVAPVPGDCPRDVARTDVSIADGAWELATLPRIRIA